MPVGASRSGAEHVHLSPTSANASGAARVLSTKLDQCALARIQRMVASAPIQFELWDGFKLKSMAGPPVGTIRFKNRLALFGWVWDPDLNVGEAYMSGTIEMRGDLVPILEAIYRAVDPARPRAWWLWQPSNDACAAKHNVHHHYDIGNDFYRRSGGRRHRLDDQLPVLLAPARRRAGGQLRHVVLTILAAVREGHGRRRTPCRSRTVFCVSRARCRQSLVVSEAPPRGPREAAALRPRGTRQPKIRAVVY